MSNPTLREVCGAELVSAARPAQVKFTNEELAEDAASPASAAPKAAEAMDARPAADITREIRARSVDVDASTHPFLVTAEAARAFL